MLNFEVFRRVISSSINLSFLKSEMLQISKNVVGLIILLICMFVNCMFTTFFQGIPVTYTFQAMSEFERKHWVESLGGTWPAVNTLQKLRADSVEDNLNRFVYNILGIICLFIFLFVFT